MKKRFINSIFALTFMVTLIFTVKTYVCSRLPDAYYLSQSESKNFTMYPFSVNVENECKQCINSEINSSDPKENYFATINFMNILPLKRVKLFVSDDSYVVPCGIPFGVKLYTKGALIIGTSSVKSYEGILEPWSNAGIKKGDVVIEVDGKEVMNNNDLENIIQNSDGREIDFKILRDNTEFITQLRPLKSLEDGKYRIGIWVRDSSAGIGTLTFCDKKNKVFAGLGHGICDIDTQELVPLYRGDIVNAEITNVMRGSAGVPGELKGCFSDSRAIGEICANNETGLYGVLKDMPEEVPEIPVTMKQNVRKGAAQVLTTIEGMEPKLYDINIDSINYNIKSPTKNMKISVTDEDLLSKTGGIVQGMSGSPIIQDGALVGAITHVFVNNPTKGYAIFAETMLTNSNVFLESKYKNIS